MKIDSFLRIYMNDQLALGMLWREVARRAARENRGAEFGDVLARVAAGITEDVDTFARIMERLGLPRNRVKTGAAVALERVGRLKLNGRVRSYSPLSRFIELDFLAMGIDGKKLLWANLRDLAAVGARLPDVDFDHLIERAEQQREALEPFRARAGREAFGAEPVSAPAE